MPMEALPNHACPLCGRPNECAAARHGRLDVECWCTRTRVNPESLALVPPELRGKACLCRECATTPPHAVKGPPSQ